MMLSHLTLGDVRNLSDETLMFARGTLDKLCHDAADEASRAEQRYVQARQDRDRVLTEIDRRGLR